MALEIFHPDPINISNERVSGLLASLNYRHDMGRWGSLGATAQYNVTLNHKYRQLPVEIDWRFGRAGK